MATNSILSSSSSSSYSSSSSSSRLICKYHAFVSFRGDDTRNNFTDHLFGALHRKGIRAFRDDTNLKKGESIAPELLQAIEESQVLIVVFSKNYASSTWCLQELAKIADCIDVHGQRKILPIFYDLSPSEVRKQSGGYGEAFAKHEERFKDDEEKMKEVQRWRQALKQMGSLSGWDVSNKPQYAEIEKITKVVVTSLMGHKFSNIPDNIVGLHLPLEELEKLLDLDSNANIRVIGICGMGGIGKSTLATYMYGRISNQFDAYCFIDDVSKIYGEYGPIGVPKELVCQTLSDESLQICNLFKASDLIQTRLCQIKTLIVLDNVDKVEQLENLALKWQWLGAGSRIIIISRDKHILKEHGVDEVYEVQLLNNCNARQLFCKKAFKSDDIIGDYIDLANDVLRYANGHPLAIKVLGSFLFGKNVFEWRSALVKLRENPKKDIMVVFRVSFDELENNEKEIFLDIACFFSGNFGDHVRKILDIRGFHADIGIGVLVDKSLITCERGYIRMHDLLKELGKSIVRENSPKEPRKWSRLWDYKDLHNVTLENLEADNLEAIVMQEYPKIIWKTPMRVDALSKMNHLKLLILYNVNFSGRLHYLSNELGYLFWDKYPFTDLPSRFQPDKLVELVLPHSNIKQLWKGTKYLPALRTLNLSHSKSLIGLPDFRGIPNLKKLSLEGCEGIVQIDPSIGTLSKFKTLNLKNCKNLVSIPKNIFLMDSLRRLNLSGCSKLFKNQLLENPSQTEHLMKFGINESSIIGNSASSIYKILMLPFHVFHSKRQRDSVGLLLASLPLTSLSCLDLSFCNLYHIPDAVACLTCLVRLNLGGNNFVTLPSTIKELSKLCYLNLEHCKQLKYLPELPRIEGTWVELYIFDCPNLSERELYIYNAAFSWISQYFEVNMQFSPLGGEIEVVVPGSQIPGWFNKQNVGSSISLDPTPIMHDENWIAIACCVTFVTHDDPANVKDESQSHVDPMHKREGTHVILWGFGNEGRSISMFIPIHLRKDLVTVELDHTFLCCVSRQSFFRRYVPYMTKGGRNLNGIELVSMIDYQPQGLNVEVKSCGYRLVYMEDLQQLNPKMMFGKKFPSRKLKFLTNDSPNH